VIGIVSFVDQKKNLPSVVRSLSFLSIGQFDATVLFSRSFICGCRRKVALGRSVGAVSIISFSFELADLCLLQYSKMLNWDAELELHIYKRIRVCMSYLNNLH